MDERETLQGAYRDFNARMLDAVLAYTVGGVKWPNGWEGGFVHGHEGTCDYWTLQRAVLDPRLEPVEICKLDDGRFAVEVHQVVHDRQGTLIADQRMRHIYQLRNGLIERMHIEEAAP